MFYGCQNFSLNIDVKHINVIETLHFKMFSDNLNLKSLWNCLCNKMLISFWQSCMYHNTIFCLIRYKVLHKCNCSQNQNSLEWHYNYFKNSWYEIINTDHKCSISYWKLRHAIIQSVIKLKYNLIVVSFECYYFQARNRVTLFL